MHGQMVVRTDGSVNKTAIGLWKDRRMARLKARRAGHGRCVEGPMDTWLDESTAGRSRGAGRKGRALGAAL